MKPNSRHDEYNWNTYTQSAYEPQLLRTMNAHDMLVTNFVESKEEGIVFSENSRLHPNWKQLYYIVNKLGVNSVYECGCGCVHHLINIKEINPEIKVSGCDYSHEQINLGYKYFQLDKYDFHTTLQVKDLTDLNSTDDLDKYEFVYTQAVLMHLTESRAKLFLQNMKKISSKYIFLIENPSRQNWDKLFSEVLPEYERVPVDDKYIKDSILLKLRE